MAAIWCRQRIAVAECFNFLRAISRMQVTLETSICDILPLMSARYHEGLATSARRNLGASSGLLSGPGMMGGP